MSIARQARLLHATRPQPFAGANYAAAIGAISAELLFVNSGDREPAKALERIAEIVREVRS